MPHDLVSDESAHEILELAFDEIPAFGRKVVTVSTELQMSVEPRLESLQDPSAWLAAERYIEVDEPDVLALSAELDRGSPMATANAIYQWVTEHLTYAGYIAEDLGARWALHHRRGDCTEFADLAVALARCRGIPARMVGGYVTASDAAPRAGDYHNWAEFYVRGAWRLVDCQKRRLFEHADDYIVFRIYRDKDLNPIGSANRYRVDGDLVLTY